MGLTKPTLMKAYLNILDKNYDFPDFVKQEVIEEDCFNIDNDKTGQSISILFNNDKYLIEWYDDVNNTTNGEPSDFLEVPVDLLEDQLALDAFIRKLIKVKSEK